MRWMLCLALCLAGFRIEATELIWKRAPILEQDLARALDLNVEDLCQELGRFSCLNQVHNYALGGHDPFERGQYRPMEQPSQLTTIAFERVIHLSCIKRLEKDIASSQPRVFRYFALNEPLMIIPDADVSAQITDLYQRFLLRDPSANERVIALTLADRQRFGTRPGRELAQALCLAIGSQLEFLLF